MILRRVAIFSKLAILWVVNWLSKNFTVRTPKMLLAWYAKIDQKKTVNKRLVRVCCKLAIFWTTMGLGANFIGKTNSKMWLWWSLAKDFQKTMISRRLIVFCKLVIAFFVKGFNKNFKVKRPKCGFDKRHQKTKWKRRLRCVWEYFAN